MRFLKTWKKNKYKVSLSPHSDYVLRRHFGGTGTKVTEINSTPLVRGSTRQVKITCVTCGGSLWDGVAPGKQTQKVTKTSWVLLFVCLSVVGGAGGNEPMNLFGRGLPLDYTPPPNRIFELSAEEFCKCSTGELTPPTVQVPRHPDLGCVRLRRFTWVPGALQAKLPVRSPPRGGPRCRPPQAVRGRGWLPGAAGDNDALPAREGPAPRL